MKIVIDNKIPFIKGVFEPLATVEYHSGSEINKDTVNDADALIVRTRTKCNKALLEGSKVKFIATATIGFDHIDTQFCKQNNIRWTNAPGCNSGSVMQYVASVLVRLSLLHDFDLSEKMLGIVGVGNVGSKVAKLALALGMKVLLNDPPRERKEKTSQFVSLTEIQKQADIITFHTPLIREGIDRTYHLLDNDFVKSLKTDTTIINTSRGEVTDNRVLETSLKNQTIKGVVLDVWENEPDINIELLNLATLTTPHIAGYSTDGKANGTAMSVRAVSQFFNLRIDKWFPSKLPSPPCLQPEIDCANKSVQEVINELILLTYDVKKDDQLLRSSLHTFEQQRGGYPGRREFNVYKPILLNDKNNIAKTLKAIGFSSPT